MVGASSVSSLAALRSHYEAQLVVFREDKHNMQTESFAYDILKSGTSLQTKKAVASLLGNGSVPGSLVISLLRLFKYRREKTFGRVWFIPDDRELMQHLEHHLKLISHVTQALW